MRVSLDAANLNAAVMERSEQDLKDTEQQLRAVQQNRIFLQSQLNQARAAGRTRRASASWKTNIGARRSSTT